jgi:folate-binding protein YgfZ
MDKTLTQEFDLESYEAIRNGGASWVLSEKKGVIAVSGGEAVQFLNGLITNDVSKLSENEWVFAAFPNAKGRLLSIARIDVQEGRFIFETEEATYKLLLANLQRFTFAGDFHVEDLSNSKLIISLRGEKAGDILDLVFEGGFVPGPNAVDSVFDGRAVRVLPSVRIAGFDLRIDAEKADDLVKALVSKGAVIAGGPLAEVLRVESGIPKFGVDMDDETVVPEVGLEDLISYQKGCYIGQEVIARIHFRGKVAKQLKGVVFDAPEAPVSAGTEMLSPEGKNAGFITSKAYSPRLKKHIAMAMVRNAYLEPGTELTVNLQTCRVCALPFIN